MSTERVAEAREIDITSYLTSKGIKPKSKGSYWMYKSPLPARHENVASLAVSRRINRWCDFGKDNTWHDIIDLVMEIESCTFPKALNILLGTEISEVKIFEKDNLKATDNIRIVSRNKLADKDLIEYVESRKVNVDIAKKYCKQLNILFPNSQSLKVHRVIGFKNNLGGYEIRNNFFKISTQPKYYTMIGSGGDRYIFEGFFDFLSYLTFKNEMEINGIALILNTLTMFSKIYKYMKTPGINNLFLDNDNAADKKIEELKIENISFVDHRYKYKNYNDINQFLIERP